MNEKKPFRVIIVGGGVGGLTASHCLQKAGIDHVLLERRSTAAPPEGASISLYPNGLRIVNQLGLRKAMDAISTPAKYLWWRRPDGSFFRQGRYYDYIVENHGRSSDLFERREFLQVLYDTLPNKTPIRTDAGVVGVKELPDGVQVTLNDGSVENGDIIIGCDGVHSFVRNAMWENANKVAPGLITEKEKTSMVTSWKGLIGIAPAEAKLGQRDATIVFGQGHSFLLLSDPERIFFFVFIALEKPFHWPERVRYTDDDVEAVAAGLADSPITDSLTFGDLWKKRYRGTLVPLEEGVLEHWYHGRTALAGDSVHKVTPNLGLGGNLTMESVVVLCNCIQEMLVAQNGGKPSQDAITNAFAKYQALQIRRANQVCEISAANTRGQSWHTTFYKLMVMWLEPLFSDRFGADMLGEMWRRAPKLNYVDLEDAKDIRLSWKEINLAKKQTWFQKKVRSRLLRSTIKITLSAAAVATVAISLCSWRIID
ncbi:FAD binding domain protein [Hypoxylon trugodes]|uniref:FAD binding domain protein n=1 Tax=Hypoxylon trugodes TaxID=326681 RepID=UPI00219D998F|nr:FAD binding domain protein [Hypoxylon trugodes]KAI1389961.1 FAD binding domain protein [Hypoxylon trugodes]